MTYLALYRQEVTLSHAQTMRSPYFSTALSFSVSPMPAGKILSEATALVSAHCLQQSLA